MRMNYWGFLPAYRYARVLAVASSLLAAFGLNAFAQEEAIEPDATTTPAPSASFQYGTLTGTTNTINASLVPIVNASGAPGLYNVALHFGFNASGQLIVTSLQSTPAPPPIVAGFKAGTYCGPIGWDPNLVINVRGPGLTSGGATEWTLAQTPKSYYNTYPSSATWYVGALPNNPIYARIQAAKINFSGWSYGFGGGAYAGEGGDWRVNSLLAFSQVGNTLTIESFTDNNGIDHSQPVNQITYTACSAPPN